jgi:hypothetical protein
MLTRNSVGSARPAPALADPHHESVVVRLRRGIAEAGLDCACREAAQDMLDRIGAEEEIVLRAEALADARKMRDAIVLVLALLGEIDELTPEEPDRTAFHEIAGLFQDIAGFASFGASAARRAAGVGEN